MYYRLLHLESHSISFNLILQSQSVWSLFNGTWPKRRRELDTPVYVCVCVCVCECVCVCGLNFEIREMTLQMQQAIHKHRAGAQELSLCNKPTIIP